MKYKVGDKVKLKSKEGLYEMERRLKGMAFNPEVYDFAGSVCTICDIVNGWYIFDVSPWVWHENVIEGLVEDTDERLLESAADAWKKIDEMMEARYQKAKTYYDREQWSTEFECPEGYIFKDENGNVINATKIVLEKKKKEYPKTYEECAKIAPMTWGGVSFEHYNKLLSSFYELLICRDAYWKIAGEEMGLGKPWELSIGTSFYYIYYNRTLDTTKKDYADDIHGNVILAFPTKEMRDAFYENFKKEIEFCKELL